MLLFCLTAKATEPPLSFSQRVSCRKKSSSQTTKTHGKKNEEKKNFSLQFYSTLEAIRPFAENAWQSTVDSTGQPLTLSVKR